MKLLGSALLAGALLLGVGPASAATVVLGGGATTVALDPATVSALDALGIALAPLGSASVAGGAATFPITGGSIDTAALQAQVFHAGSGLRFSTAAATLDLMDFVIDAIVAPGAESGVLAGNASGAVNAFAVPIFDIGPGLVLTLRGEAAGALSAAFDIPDLAGAVFGTASVSPSAVPEPSSIALFGAGALALAAWRRVNLRRRA